MQAEEPTGGLHAAPVARPPDLTERWRSYSVSVVVPTFNRARYIGECIDSLLAQTMPAGEILVVDDGSEDDTAERVRAYGERVRYVYKQNGGKPSAVNLALTLVKGDLVWIFDDDDVALPDAIERRIETLAAEPGAGYVYSPHYLGSDNAAGRIVRNSLHPTPEYAADRFFGEILKGCFYHLATALVRRDLYERVGGFDSSLLSSEDYDMQIRLARAAPAAYCPYPTFVFRQHSGARGASAFRYSGSERAQVFRRYDGMIGRKLRAELPLGEYVVPRRELSNTLSDLRRALLSRMVVMASKGCVAETLEDLASALRTLGPDAQLDEEESRFVSNAISTGYAYEACRAEWPAFKSRVLEILGLPAGRQAIGHLSRGVLRVATSYPGPVLERLEALCRAVSLARIAIV